MSTPTTRVLDSLSDVWGQALQPAGCQSCRQVFLLSSGQENVTCPLCGQAVLAKQSAWLRPAAPELLVPFSPEMTPKVPGIIESFVNEVWFKADDFNSANLRQRLRPIYWVQWLVDGEVIGSWSCESGYNYQVKSSQENYSDGNWRSRELIETRIRWEARLGRIQRAFQNVNVPAFSHQDRLTALVGDYDRRRAVPYAPVSLGQAAVMAPDLQPDEVWQAAQAAFNQAAAADVQTACEAQHQRQFMLDAAYESPNWTQLLLPLYCTRYQDDEGRSHSLFINGQSGKMGGVRMASQHKGWLWAGGLAAAALVMLIAAVICFLAGSVFPPAAAVGILLVIVAIVAGLCAIFPAVSPWQWNRGQREIPDFIYSSSGEVSKK